ncbi:hypothetical protein [Autumnicola musiva]|uniref:Uncharacterized protein n=1 Tax=Autumnicola musiva TaxID=3075589 RepID=A0ABU3D3C6_9FLAO|nr:hypothetical protein [Zunongwangia sp. F117]MDT0676027.1 hypothetical protein [Zunongwangia sp. F117]
MSHRNLVIISKIIFFYSIFYVVMKITVVIQGAWLWPNLILSLPFLAFITVGIYMLKINKYYWAYVISGAIVIGVVRYYEREWMLALQQHLS